MDRWPTRGGAALAARRAGMRRSWVLQFLAVIALALGGGYLLSPRSPVPSWATGWLGQTPGRVCTVDRVLDGDSLRLVCQGEPVEVRLHCIDAPEYEQEPWGTQSRRHLAEITPFQVELQAVDTDRFGRTVGNVYTTGADRRLLNLDHVASGNAAVYTR